MKWLTLRNIFRLRNSSSHQFVRQISCRTPFLIFQQVGKVQRNWGASLGADFQWKAELSLDLLWAHLGLVSHFFPPFMAGKSLMHDQGIKYLILSSVTISDFPKEKNSKTLQPSWAPWTARHTGKKKKKKVKEGFIGLSILPDHGARTGENQNSFELVCFNFRVENFTHLLKQRGWHDEPAHGQPNFNHQWFANVVPIPFPTSQRTLLINTYWCCGFKLGEPSFRKRAARERYIFVCDSGEQRVGETLRGGNYHDIYLGTWVWHRRCLDWIRVENSEVKIKFGGPFHRDDIRSCGYESNDQNKMYRGLRRKEQSRGQRKGAERESGQGRRRRKKRKRTQGQSREVGSWGGVNISDTTRREFHLLLSWYQPPVCTCARPSCLRRRSVGIP